MKGTSICMGCQVEFKWYRNESQGPAKYCSKLCKDKNHSTWFTVVAKNKHHICEECMEKFERRSSSTRPFPRFCSKVCMNKNVETWNKKNRFLWATATEEQKKQKLKETFEKNVIKKDGCWGWKGCTHGRGYACIRGIGRKQQSAHQISYIIHKGDIEEGMNVLHHCDNRICSNPDHLYLGTHAQNMKDKTDRNRSARGEKNARSKLKEAQVIEIKNMIKDGLKDKEISKKFQVTCGTIYAIKSGITWKHVHIEDEELVNV